MNFSKIHFSKKCRTCNTLASQQHGVLDASSGHDSAVGACSASGDACSKDELEDKTITQQLSQINLACPPSQSVSSSNTPDTIQSDSSTPCSDSSSNVSGTQKKTSLPNDSLLQYHQQEQEINPVPTLLHFSLRDRSVIGQEKSPISGMACGVSAAAGSASSRGGTAELAPKERRRWVRPPLIGQAANSTDVKITSDELQPSGEDDSVLDDSGTKINESDIFDRSAASSNLSGLKHEKLKSSSSNESANNSSLSKSIETGESTDENIHQMSFQTSVDGEQGILSDSYVGGKASPSSSVASHRRLEWDSGADVGYQDYQGTAEGQKTSILKLSAIERLALIQNTDKALRMRLDPEGTSCSVPSTGNNPTPTISTYPLTLQYSIGQPSAESTPIERAGSFQSQKKSGAIGISPITMADSSKQASSSNNPVQEFKGTEEQENASPKQRSPSVPRTRSASLLNLSTAVTDPSDYLYLYRSHSDPDFSADTGAHTDDSCSLKFSPRKPSKGRGLGMHPLSSGSEKTLVHVPTEKSKNESRNVLPEQVPSQESREQTGLAHILNKFNLPQTFTSISRGYSCSDNDHRHGLHHHYGILCSSCLVIPSELAPQNPSRLAESYNRQESPSSSVNSSQSSTSHSAHSENGDSGQHIRRKESSQENADTQDRATSVTPPADEMREGTSAYVGKTTSFEYLPGQIYESEMAAVKSITPTQQEHGQQLSQSPSSDSSSINSGQNSVRHQVVQLPKNKPVTTSSGDSEDALWSSPRISSGTLVRDLERGVNLLRGLFPHKAAFYNTAAQRELVRKIVQRLVSSEYTDDLLERQNIRRQNRRPLSGGHTFGAHQPSFSNGRTESEQRPRSATHRSTKRVQSSGSSRAPVKTYIETCTQPSDTVSSAAAKSSSLRSSSANESPNASKEPPIRKQSNENQSGSQPAPPSSNASAEQHSNSAPIQPANHSTLTGILNAPPVVNVARVTTMDASTTTNQELKTAVSYGTLSSVVSITPMTITVQSSPAVPLREVDSELPPPTATKVTANAATMTSPPSFGVEPRTCGTEPPAGSSASVPDKEVRGSNEERRKKKIVSSSHQRQQLQTINCEISHLQNLQKMLKKHPHIIISSPVEPIAPSHPSSNGKAKVSDCPTSDDHLESVRRSRHPHPKSDRSRSPSTSNLRKSAPVVSSADSRSTITSSVLSSSSASNCPPNCPACAAGSAPVTSKETTEEEKRPDPHFRRTEHNERSRKQRGPSPESEDSVTRAITQAVSSRVRTLRHLGQIEEAEVKIRVRMGQPSDAEGPPVKPGSRPIIDPTPKMSISHPRPSRQVEESDYFDSKLAGVDETISRQFAMHAEARKRIQLLNEIRENTLRRNKVDQQSKRDACTLTSVDNATNTTPLNSATHVVSRSTQMKESSVESSSTQLESSPRKSSCPACRVRASSKKPPENEPMCRHDPGFTAGQPRGRQRPPTAYFLKVEEEDVVIRAETPPRSSSLQVVTVKVPRPVRPPSSIGSSGSLSSESTSSKQSRVSSPMRSPKAKALSIPAFGHDSRSSPESRKKRTPRKLARRNVATSRSEPQLGRGDADKFVPEYSSDEETATGTLQDCLASNFPEYIEAAERRRQCIYEMSHLRRRRQESRKRLVQLDGDEWLTRQKQARSQKPQKPATAPTKAASRPKQSSRSMRQASAKKYSRMFEVEQKRIELKKKEEKRANRLLKEIYTTKLREKALRGQTTLRSSVSVISSF